MFSYLPWPGAKVGRVHGSAGEPCGQRRTVTGRRTFGDHVGEERGYQCRWQVVEADPGVQVDGVHGYLTRAQPRDLRRLDGSSLCGDHRGQPATGGEFVEGGGQVVRGLADEQAQPNPVHGNRV